MTERLFRAPETIDISDHTPLVFLEGPVQGALDWQTPLAERLVAARSDIAVAIPRGLPEHDAAFRSEDERTRQHAPELQVAYEWQARRLAMDLGILAMWWAPQHPDAPIPNPPERVYGKTSNFELGEILGWAAANPGYPVIVGYDPEFVPSKQNSMDYQLRNLDLMGRKTYTSIEEFEQAILAHAPRAGAQEQLVRIPHASSVRSMQRALDLLRSR